MHPHSHLIVLAPPISTDDGTDSNASSSSSSITRLNLIIGANNVFEERCRVVIDLTDEIKKIGDSKNDVSFLMIGSGNVFSVMSHVQCRTTIGDYNVFSAASQVHVHQVQNGCNFSPNVRYLNSKTINENENKGDGGGFVLDHQVVFRLSLQSQPKNGNAKRNDDDDYDDCKGICVRNHLDGAVRNKVDVLAYIATMRGIMEKHHKLMDE